MDIVGHISYGELNLDVYESMDEPHFKVLDISQALGYRYDETNIDKLSAKAESFEVTIDIGTEPPTYYVTETGLYNLLAQSKKPIAKTWRQVIFKELIKLRKEKELKIDSWFDYLDEMSDIFCDEDGVWWKSVTVAGGDVEQVRYYGESIDSEKEN